MKEKVRNRKVHGNLLLYHEETSNLKCGDQGIYQQKIYKLNIKYLSLVKCLGISNRPLLLSDRDDCERWSHHVRSNIGGYRRRVNPWLYIVQLCIFLEIDYTTTLCLKEGVSY
jgi:hypothetical protein